LLLLANCGQEKAPLLRRLVVLPIENLDPAQAFDADAAGLQWAIADAFQGQPSLHAVSAGHRREQAALAPVLVVSGYLTSGMVRLHLNGDLLQCTGPAGDCARPLIAEIGAKIGLTPRSTPKPETLRRIGGTLTTGEPVEALERTAAADPQFAAVWLAWAARVQTQEGPAKAAAVLQRAPSSEMAPYDAALLRLRLAELQQDRKAGVAALQSLARLAPMNLELQERAARESTASRDLGAALSLYEGMHAILRQPEPLNQAAYLAAFIGDRAKAERYGAMAEQAAPDEARYLDTRGEIAYYFGDYAAAAGHFERAAIKKETALGGLDWWKAAAAARQAGDSKRAEAFLARYIEFRVKAGARNSLLIQAVWDWHGDSPDSAIEKLRQATDSLDRGKALFLLSLVALNRKDIPAAQRWRAQMDPASIEAAFLRAILDGVPPPPGLPFPPEAVAALRFSVMGDTRAALEALEQAKPRLDPLADGQWRKLEAILAGKKPDGVLPPSPDDWLAVLLR
jgi:hypothetical protein